MKLIKKIIAIVLVLATLICTAAMAEFWTYSYLTATGNCNLREGPGLNYKIIRVIHTGDKVIYDGDTWETDERGVTWYRVTTSNGQITGWASSVYLHDDAKSIGTVKTTGNVHMRDKATINGKILLTVPKGKTVKCTAIQYDENGVIWFLITYAGKVGWVSSKYAVEIR